MKQITIVTQIKSKKDLNKALSNMVKARIKKDVDKILEGGEVKFITGGVKKTIKEMPEDLKNDLMEFYANIFEAVLEAMQKGEDLNMKALDKKDKGLIHRLNNYIESRFE